MIAAGPAALVLLGGILLVVGVLVPRFAPRWRKWRDERQEALIAP